MWRQSQKDNQKLPTLMAAIAHGDAELEPETEPESVKWLRGLARRLNNILSVFFLAVFWLEKLCISIYNSIWLMRS